MLPETDPRGNSVDLVHTAASDEISVRVPADQPHPGALVPPALQSESGTVSDASPEITIPQVIAARVATPPEVDPAATDQPSANQSFPASPAAIRLDLPLDVAEQAAFDLAMLRSQLHAAATPDGFAPSRDKFMRLSPVTTRTYERFYSSYEEFVRSSGLKTANERRRHAGLQRRAAERAAAQGTRTLLTPPPAPKLQPVKSQVELPHAEESPESAVIPRQLVSLAPETNPQRSAEPVYGARISGCDMMHAPVNEQGVVLLFGMLAGKLGFEVEMVRTGYPDCEAKRKGKDGKLRKVRIEFEYVTSRFDHPPEGCDLIVCWEDDSNPTNLEVLELKNHVGKKE